MVVGSTSQRLAGTDRPFVRIGVPVALLAMAAAGWWWSVRMADHMRVGAMDPMGNGDGMGGMRMSTGTAMGVGGFLLAWLAMMTAMMLPAITPVVKLYARASALDRVAPLPYFVGGYLDIWTVLGLPAYFAWSALDTPLAEGATWAARLAGASFVAAGLWQLTPVKDLCLRHCRSPMSFFLAHGNRLERPTGALRMGAAHGLFCTGCCWAMFALLVALGTMNLGWMLILTALIVVEKTSRHGHRVAAVAGGAFVILGLVLLSSPGSIEAIT